MLARAIPGIFLQASGAAVLRSPQEGQSLPAPVLALTIMRSTVAYLQVSLHNADALARRLRLHHQQLVYLLIEVDGHNVAFCQRANFLGRHADHGCPESLRAAAGS